MIVHIDMDAYYASVEIRDNPSLRGKPVVVGGSPQGRGVVSAANYEARKFGIHSAMPAAEAVRRCGHLVFLKSRMEHYATISKQIRNIMHRYTPLVEPLSLDEAFLDVTGSEALFGPSVEIARQIKAEILSETGLVASAGVAPNKYLAKVASDLEKPDGFVVVDSERIEEFLGPLSIRRVWGIGRKTEQKFNNLGVQTIADLRRLRLAELRNLFGVNADHYWRLARGLDSRSVVPDRLAKSISHETTFASDIHDHENLIAWSQQLTDQVARRLRRYDIFGKTVQLKIRYSDFHTLTRSATLAEPTHCTETIREQVQVLLDHLPISKRGVRLLGVGVSNLVGHRAQQGVLFDDEGEQRNERLDGAVDQIRDRFGDSALKRASGLRYNIQHRLKPGLEDE